MLGLTLLSFILLHLLPLHLISVVELLVEQRVDGLAHVVDGRGSQDDAGRPEEARHREHPEEQAVQYHGDKFPILDDLDVKEMQKRRHNACTEGCVQLLNGKKSQL